MEIRINKTLIKNKPNEEKKNMTFIVFIEC